MHGDRGARLTLLRPRSGAVLLLLGGGTGVRHLRRLGRRRVALRLALPLALPLALTLTLPLRRGAGRTSGAGGRGGCRRDRDGRLGRLRA